MLLYSTCFFPFLFVVIFLFSFILISFENAEKRFAIVDDEHDDSNPVRRRHGLENLRRAAINSLCRYVIIYLTFIYLILSQIIFIYLNLFYLIFILFKFEIKSLLCEHCRTNYYWHVLHVNVWY